MRQAKVFAIPLRSLTEVLHGRARVLNMPSDGQVVAVVQAGRDLVGLRVHSESYPPAQFGDQLPLVTAALERRPRR